MSVCTIKDSEGKEFIIFDESELYDDNEMGNNLEDFDILQILGKGSYGFVAKIRSLKNKKIYAMKQIDLSKLGSEKEKQLCINEVSLLKDLNHPNINKYYKTINLNNCLYIIMEFMDNGDISGFINAHKKFQKPVKEEEVWNILLQSMNALEYLHKKKVIHRDIKPANLFMTNDKIIKIGDFGVSAKMESLKTSIRDQGTFNNTVVGTPLYMSPEMINNEEYDEKNDIFSMGCTFHEICFFSLPYKSLPNNDIVQFIKNEKKANENYYSQPLLDIINNMIELRPEKRYSAEKIREMVKKEYTKHFVKTSSLSSVLRCLYALPKLTNAFFKFQNNINSKASSYVITKGYIDAILNIHNNVNDKFNEFKEILATENPKLNTDDEIDPRFIVALLLEKMHKELNQIRQNQNNENQYIISYNEDKSNKSDMMERFVKHFTENFNSIISNLFFGMLKEKKTCQNCNMYSYNFGCFCLLTFDLNEICRNPNNNYSLDFLFDVMKKKIKNYTLDDHVYCDRCLSYQLFTQIKQIYSMPYELIIYLERGTNCMNKTIINFPFSLDVSKYTEFNDSPKYFDLVGTVNRVDIDGKEHYISFTKDLKSQKWISCDDAQKNPVEPQLALTFGIPVLLFYNCTEKK